MTCLSSISWADFDELMTIRICFISQYAEKGTPSKRSKAEAPLFSCIDTRKLGGPNPGMVIYSRLAAT
jgi:hypothetical protein